MVEKFKCIAPLLGTELLRVGLVLAVPSLTLWSPDVYSGQFRHCSGFWVDLNNIAESNSVGMTAGGAIFQRLKTLGVDYVFANSGTDFPPIIEGLAEAMASGADVPTAVAVGHEHAAMGMAHGYFLISGFPQAVMLHTNVGLANGAIGAINAACEHIPLMLLSGRTPTTESGRFGARTVPIGWGQEMRDQTALVREACKWDCELRAPEQIFELLDRGHAIASSTPKGPVYISLPREVLCEAVDAERATANPQFSPALSAPAPRDIEAAADLLANSKRPLIIAQRGAGDDLSFDAFSEMVRAWGIPVCTWWATSLAISTEHECHVGADPGPWLQDADVVLVLNSLAPWWPDRHPLSPSAAIINMGPDPIFSKHPVRNFRSDLSIAGELAISIPQLAEAMHARLPASSLAGERRIEIESKSRAEHDDLRKSAFAPRSAITKAFVSAVLSDVLENVESSVFSELGAMLGTLKRTKRNSWFQEPHSGGLGWSFPCAIGASLADPERLCVAVMGDGSYIFSNPVACHQICESLSVPVLAIVLNNEGWGAVRQSVTQLYPDGLAAKLNRMPLTSLSPSPNFTMVAAASRAFAKRVEDPSALSEVLEKAVEISMVEKRQAFVEVKIGPE